MVEAVAKASFEFWNEPDEPWEMQLDDTKTQFREAASDEVDAFLDTLEAQTVWNKENHISSWSCVQWLVAALRAERPT